MAQESENMFNFCISGSMDELLHRCGSDLTRILGTSKIEELTKLTNKIDNLSNIIRLSTVVLESNIPSTYMEICKSTNLDIKDAALLTLSEYTKLPQAKLLDIISNANSIGEILWTQYVKDPDAITQELLDGYYNQCGNYNLYLQRYFSSLNVSLGTALIGYVALVANEIGGKCFDFGGGIGNLSASMSKLGHKEVYMVETDTKQLDFVKWKDKKSGIENINYIGLDEIDNFFDSHQASFRFGAAIELLEHVMDPPALMEKLGSLIEPGGYLFLVNSFHVYPHPGHLKSNIQYTDKEDEILKPLGFVRAEFNDPAIPFLFNWKLFQKVS